MKETSNMEIAQALISRLNATKRMYPRFFEAQDKFTTANNQLSMYQIAYIMKACYDTSDEREIYVVSAMSQWRIYKKIYNFDKDLLEMLFDQKAINSIMNLSANADFFKNLPFNGLCMYNSIDNELAITTLEDTINGKKAIMFYCINLNDLIKYSSESGMMTFSINPVALYDDCTIGEALLRDFDNDSQRDKYAINYRRLISMLVYILSANAEISKSGVTQNTYRPNNNGQIKDKFREIEQMDVGINIGNTIRLHKKTNKTYHVKNITGLYKRPHIRSGHWHSFWTGKRGSNERTLIVKWIQPMFVNSNNSKNVTINRATL